MSFAIDNPNKSKSLTQYTDSLSLSQHDFSTLQHLIVIRLKNRIVEIFQPKEKHITIGRSSKNSITLSDPRLSREALEIILGPISLLRRKKFEQKYGDFIAINPGKSFHFHPYTLTLLEQGGIIFNRHNISSRKIVMLMGCMLFAIMFLGTRATISQYQGGIITTLNTKEMSYPVSTSSKDNKDGKFIHPGKIRKYDNNKQKAKYSETIVSEHTVDSEVVSDKLETFLPKKIDVFTRVQQNKVTMREKSNFYDIELNNAIKTAVQFIQQGDLKTAGRILSPILPHADSNQRQIIIDTLDPIIQILFKKAYMLKFYEPMKSREIMQNIADSGLQMLPGYQKAIKSLEIEQSMSK